MKSKKMRRVSTIYVIMLLTLTMFFSWKMLSEDKIQGVFNASDDSTVVNLDERDCVDVFSSDEGEEVLIETKDEKYEIKSMKNIPEGEALRIIFSNEEKILLSNTKFLVYIDITNGMEETFIDLTKLDNSNSIRSEISVDRTGENVVYCSFNEKDNIKSIYYIDVKEGTGLKIGDSEIEDFVDSWSFNSNYYVFGDREGKNIVVFDRVNLEVHKIDFQRDFLKKALVTDSGEVFIEGNRKYVIKKNENYEVAECVIAGVFLATNRDTIITYNNGTISQYKDGAMKKINELPEKAKIMRQIKGNVILSDENGTMIYNIEDNTIHNYAVKYEYIDMIVPNNTGEKCLIKSSRYNNRILGSNGQYYKIKDIRLMKIVGECSWVNLQEIIGIYYDEEDRAVIIKVEI